MIKIDKDLIELGNRLLNLYVPFCEKGITEFSANKYWEVLIKSFAKRWNLDLKRDLFGGETLYRAFRRGGGGKAINEKLAIFYFGHINNWEQVKMDEEYRPLVGVQQLSVFEWWPEFKRRLKEETKNTKNNPVTQPQFTEEQKGEISKQLLRERENMNVDSQIAAQIKLLEESKKFAEADALIAQLQTDDEASLASKYYQRAGLGIIQNRLETAFDYYKKALALQPENETYISDMAAFLVGMGLYSNAKELYLSALHLSIQKNGEVNKDVGAIYNDLGYVSSALCEYKIAREYYEKGLEIEEKIFGKRHPRTAIVINNLACLEQETGKSAEAARLFKRALKIDIEYLEEKHLDISIRYNNIGIVYLESGKAEKALAYFKKSMAILKDIYDEVHPQIASGYINFGSAYKEMKDFDSALENLNHAVILYDEIYKKSHPQKAVCSFNMGWTYYLMGDFKLALQNYQKAHLINKEFFHSRHLLIGRDHYYMGMAHADLGNLETAVSFCQIALDIYGLYYSSRHVRFKKIKKSLDLYKSNLYG
jgi:tetratricopeptide (TPR) repeat protein